jgi:glutaredoxin
MVKVYRFTASWCQPCKTLAKALETRGLDVPTIDVDSEGAKELMAKYGIRSVPTITIEYDNGVIKSITGSNPTLDQWLDIADALDA